MCTTEVTGTLDAAIVGNLPNFNASYGDWNTYIERLDQYFLINDIKSPEKQRALLLITIDDDGFKNIRDLVYPKAPKEKTYQELVEVVRKQKSERPSAWRHRVEFNNATQNENETIADFITRIRELAVNCKFSYELDIFLLNRFIAGVRDKDIQERLFEENHESLVLDRAIEIATAREANNKKVEE